MGDDQAKRRVAGPPEGLSAAWGDVTRRVPGLEIKPMFAEIEGLDELHRRAGERVGQRDLPNLGAYYVVEVPVGANADEIQRELARLPGVEKAYVEAGPTPPPTVSPTDDPRNSNQDYEDAAPGGIDARYAWTLAGGDGAGIGFVDMERGWTLNHEDLTGAGITVISGTVKDYHGHGTAVLGEVVAVDNAIGDVGIAPKATARVVSQWRTATTYGTAEAIVSAVGAMQFGDVLLLEAQTSYPGVSGYVPVEVEDAVFDAIRLATALGIVVVEAGANGSEDLDAFMDTGGNAILNRGSAAFRDSGAIMVGAASSASPHTRMWFSNFGSRIDCFGWGENIDTTGDGWTGTATNLYTTNFGGTSGASPIIAGAAILVQSLAESSLGFRFSPLAVRRILSNAATGTASATPASDLIGVMPNLNAIATGPLGLAPDVYLRDFVGDLGDPHTGPVSASPDIIVRPNAVANPQAAFGAGSGTENDATLGSQVESGQDNFIYARVLNQGAAPATSVTVTVYWSQVATLVTPDLWTLVGTTTLASVPVGEILTVSNGITWPAGSVPATGHYCFVGLVGNQADPAPNPADFVDWANYIAFVSNNNNVTWRNFNVVNNVPPAGTNPPGFVLLPFLLTGALKEDIPMGVEIIAKLPYGAEAFLDAPPRVLRGLDLDFEEVKGDDGEVLMRTRVNPHGRMQLGELLLPAGLKAPCRIGAKIPKDARNDAFDIVVRQTYKEMEVGRVTWRLAPVKSRKRLEEAERELVGAHR
ncbi:MAG TPA: S8 family serine peptidase [Candidatus Limnocylindrales bacterium]